MLRNGVDLLDVTLRDGGYVNGHSWSRQQASAVVSACASAAINFCEVGYYRPMRHLADGPDRPTACCPDEYLAELHEKYPNVTLSVMAHTRDVTTAAYRRMAECGVGMVRLPAQRTTLPALAPHVAAAKAAGLRVAVNLIRVSEVALPDVCSAADLVDSWAVDVFYLADSNGSLFPESVAELVAAVAGRTGSTLGFHAHDGLSLAFINSLNAAWAGCRYLDASLGGMGKGGGNLSLELIVGYLRARSLASHVMTPLAHTAAELLTPWRDGILDRCESMASGLLDLNMDAIRDHRDTGTPRLVTLVDAIAS